ncbi:antibiotic biosynthesis monooxygenase family protein [Geodermatophilus sp. SYSU D00742]
MGKVVLFKIHTREDIDQAAYEQAFAEMLERVAQIPGFIEIKGYAGEDGSELAVARFESDEAIAQWRDQPDHVRTRERGRREFFQSYDITIATETRRYAWDRDDARQAQPVDAATGLTSAP